MSIWIVLLPLLVAILAPAVARVRPDLTRFFTTAAMAFAALPAVYAFVNFDPGVAGLQFECRHPWISQFGLEWAWGIDGLNFAPVMLAAILGPVVAGMWRGQNSATLFSLVAAEIALVQGCFLAQNFILWFLFFELSLVPVFLLLKFYGDERRDSAALRFFVYTALGSVPMLAGFLFVYSRTGTFDFAKLASLAAAGELSRWLEPYGMPVFLCAVIGLAVKTPLLPLHAWMPAAYRSAPTPLTVLMTGLLSKLGVFGMLRLLVPIFPAQMAEAGGFLTGVAAITVIYGAIAALMQKEIKMILVYSSLSHVAYCALAVFALGAGQDFGNFSAARSMAVQGAALQIFNHGITAAALFLLADHIWQTGKSGLLADYGGLRSRSPNLALIFGTAVFASIGLPGLNGFVSEFLIFCGAFPLEPGWTSLAAVALVLTALYMLRLYHGIFWGPKGAATASVRELDSASLIFALFLMFFVVVGGILPSLFTDPSVPAAAKAVSVYR